MFDLASATGAAERDLGAIIDQLDGLSDDYWNAPVRCVGWRVGDLAAHVTDASRGQAEGLWRAAGGRTDLAVLDPSAEREPRTLLAALKDEAVGARGRPADLCSAGRPRLATRSGCRPGS